MRDEAVTVGSIDSEIVTVLSDKGQGAMMVGRSYATRHWQTVDSVPGTHVSSVAGNGARCKEIYSTRSTAFSAPMPPRACQLCAAADS